MVRGRAVDWPIAPLLEIKHDKEYKPPEDDHGTHVAGILAADWRSDDKPSPGVHDVEGMCPDIEISTCAPSTRRQATSSRSCPRCSSSAT